MHVVVSSLREQNSLTGCLRSGCMHVVVSSLRVVFHHCIISFVISCCGFVVVPGVWSLHVFSCGPFVRFVFDALHSSCYCSSSSLFSCFTRDLLLVARWLFLLLRLTLSGS